MSWAMQDQAAGEKPGAKDATATSTEAKPAAPEAKPAASEVKKDA